MKIDHIHTIEEIRQFSSQLKHFNKPVLEGLGNAFDKDKSVDFYTGVLSGLTAAYTILKADEFSNKKTIDKMGAIIAYTAKIIEDSV